jgi:radical SAM protein with 4Fe4S-binding SPASM domain
MTLVKTRAAMKNSRSLAPVDRLPRTCYLGVVQSADSLGEGSRRAIASIAIEMTASCNQRCDYCYNEWREDGGKSLQHGKPASELRGQVVLRVEKLLEAYTFSRATLTGGEPLSHPEFFNVATRLKRAGVQVQAISNGTLVTDEVAERLAQVGLTSIQVTLNGPDAELHEAHVGKGFFDRTLRGVRAMVAHGVPVVGCIVVTQKNAASVDRILALWSDLGVKRVALSRFSPAGYAARHVAQLLPSVSDLTRAFELAEPFGQHMHLQCTMPVPPCAVETERFPHISFGVCPVGTAAQEFALGPDGALRNCTLHGAAIGGVKDILDPAVELRRLLDAPEVAEYRRTRPEFCAGCEHEHTCAGGCGAASQWVFGTRSKVDPLVQQHLDAEFSTALAFSRKAGRTHLELVS